MKQFDYAMVKDPEYFRDGRLDAHSDHVYYASEEEVWDKETSYRESLNGLWKFQYARNYESAIPGFEAEDYNCKDWEDIYVPAHIQMEGYDAPQYANVQYPWEGHEEEVWDKETSYRESLNGLWKFQYARNYESAIPGFEAEEYNCKDWEDIYVPAHIQMEGYDVPQYANVQYPWEGHEEINPGEIPTHFNPTASYVKYFTVPEQMQGKRLFISFQGAESGLALWLNGKFVGYRDRKSVV